MGNLTMHDLHLANPDGGPARPVPGPDPYPAWRYRWNDATDAQGKPMHDKCIESIIFQKGSDVPPNEGWTDSPAKCCPPVAAAAPSNVEPMVPAPEKRGPGRPKLVTAGRVPQAGNEPAKVQ